jgi:hypothetical protein
MGLGKGRGKGDRPEEENDVAFIETKPPMKTDRGSASIVGEVEGPNYKGDVQQEMKAQLQSLDQQSADPLSAQQMSRKQKAHAQQYFDLIRDGM